jgi:hypothetical protein
MKNTPDRKFVFPEDQGQDPLQLYSQIYEERIRRSLSYFSGPITTKILRSDTMTHDDHIALNIELALHTAQLCIYSNMLSHARIGLPHDLGIREIRATDTTRRWTELEYNTFWFAFMAGISPEDLQIFLRHIDENKQLNKEVFNGHTMSRFARAAEYNRLANICCAFSRTVDCVPIESMIRLPGSDISLGSGFELAIAQYLKTDIYDISYNPERIAEVDPTLFTHTLFQYLLKTDSFLLYEGLKSPVGLVRFTS